MEDSAEETPSSLTWAEVCVQMGKFDNQSLATGYVLDDF